MRADSLYRFGFRAVALILALCIFGNSAAYATQPPNPNKLKHRLMKRGIGESIVVIELDGTRVTGVISAIHDDSFEVAPREMLPPVAIAYAQVASLKNPGTSTMSKLGKGLGIAGAVYLGAGIILLIVVGAVAAAAR
jgi:hypothetical protein